LFAACRVTNVISPSLKYPSRRSAYALSASTVSKNSHGEQPEATFVDIALAAVWTTDTAPTATGFASTTLTLLCRRLRIFLAIRIIVIVSQSIRRRLPDVVPPAASCCTCHWTSTGTKLSLPVTGDGAQPLREAMRARRRGREAGAPRLGKIHTQLAKATTAPVLRRPGRCMWRMYDVVTGKGVGIRVSRGRCTAAQTCVRSPICGLPKSIQSRLLAGWSLVS
jgi:hypothetical protein